MIISGIEVEVIRKKIKNLNLSVHAPEGSVRLSVPQKTSEEAVRQFLMAKLPWIKKHQSRFRNSPVILERPPEKEYISGESHFFMGVEYVLHVVELKEHQKGKQKKKLMGEQQTLKQISEDSAEKGRIHGTEGETEQENIIRKQGVELCRGKYLYVYLKPGHTREKREKILSQWYRDQLKALIPQYIEKYEKVMGVKVAEWGIKQMKTRWGTCNPKARRIWVNLELAKRHPLCLEYIVVHEMVHLLERKHNDRFKGIMTRFLPNWESIRSELNGLEPCSSNDYARGVVTEC